MQWHHPRFPLAKLKRIYPEGETNPLRSQLLCLQHLVWCTNHALSRKSRYVIAPVFLPRKQLSFEVLGQLFAAAPNLTSITLHGHRWSQTPSIQPLVGSLAELQYLKKLEIDIRTHDGQRVPLENLFPVIQRLTELKLVGNWFSVGKKDQKLNKTTG
ncbi:hypothetical protein BGX26_007372, partial [Mortierella sp. AD094]